MWMGWMVENNIGFKNDSEQKKALKFITAG
jgi:hypothetical protein